MKFSSWIAILGICLVSCTNPYVEHLKQVAQNEQAKVQQQTAISQFDPSIIPQFPYEIAVGPDAKIANRIIELFDRAQRSIDFNMYLLTRTDMIDALVAAKKRGVKVRVILEKTVYQMPKINQKPYDTLVSAGVEVVWANEKKFNFDHAKYFIADDAVMIATGNMTKSSFEKNREFFVFSSDAKLRDMLQKIFDADFEDRELGASFDPLYLSPSDSRIKIEQLLKTAVGSIFFYTDSFSDKGLLDILAQRKSEGIDVRVCVSKQK